MMSLAITTIGDLLLRQRLTESPKSPNESVALHIPDYQRPYKWTARNAIQLLDDIIDALDSNKEKYRLGTLILNRNVKEGGYDIVDGQQRVITLSLLLKALGDDQIDFLNQRVFTNSHNLRNIPNNYNALRRRVGSKASGPEDEKKPERQRIKDFVEDQCELIVVITDDVSEAFQFFDSQNARGKELYPHDLLKAFHLREMDDVSEAETGKIVNEWEQIPQSRLREFFGNYLYRLKMWVGGSRAKVLSAHNIQMFKGVTRNSRLPYAQFYKGAYCYADMVNSSSMPFVSGIRNVNAFQLNTPIIAGKPFFEYVQHYYRILKDIRDNSKYEGFYINDNEIVKTLDAYFGQGIGNGIARLLFDTSVLLYVDRFCPEAYPTKGDMEYFDRYVVYAFIWAYSLRSQYTNLGWLSAQNYIMGEGETANSFNMYKLIVSHDTPASLLSALADRLRPLRLSKLKHRKGKDGFESQGKERPADGIYGSYLHFFSEYGFLMQ